MAVFSADNVDPNTGEVIVDSPPFTIEDDHFKRAYDGTLYLQDEWKASGRLTLNFGGRFDQVDAYVHENQVSPRLSAVYQAPTTRLFTPATPATSFRRRSRSLAHQREQI